MNKNLINHPYISVIMSVYNESNEELTKSIKSVLEQSYTDYEFIIVNDNPGNQTIASVLPTGGKNRLAGVVVACMSVENLCVMGAPKL